MERKRMNIQCEYREDIKSVAQKMFDLAKEGYIVDTIFNGVPLTTENMNSVEDILNQRNDYRKEQYEAYKNSPQYVIDKENARLKEREEQARTENLLQEFNDLDFNSNLMIIEWIGKMAVSRNDLLANLTVIQPTLEANGFLSLEKLGKVNSQANNEGLTVENYLATSTNEDEVARYLVGRAISDIQETGAISGVMSYFTKIYIDKFSEQNELDVEHTIRKR